MPKTTAADGNGIHKGPTVEHMRRIVGPFAALAGGIVAALPA
ncbi:MAG: hypothetical protein ACRDJU_12770 [Actinomycetota bacterium]